MSKTSNETMTFSFIWSVAKSSVSLGKQLHVHLSKMNACQSVSQSGHQLRDYWKAGMQGGPVTKHMNTGANIIKY